MQRAARQHSRVVVVFWWKLLQWRCNHCGDNQQAVKSETIIYDLFTVRGFPSPCMIKGLNERLKKKKFFLKPPSHLSNGAPAATMFIFIDAQLPFFFFFSPKANNTKSSLKTSHDKLFFLLPLR